MEPSPNLRLSWFTERLVLSGMDDLHNYPIWGDTVVVLRLIEWKAHFVLESSSENVSIPALLRVLADTRHEPLKRVSER